MVQDPGEAEYDGMPRSAIQTGLADFVLPLKDLGPKIVDYKGRLSSLTAPLEPDKLSETQSEALHKIFARLSSKTGHDFSHYKRPSVLRRIQRRMQVTQNADMGEYLAYMQKTPDEVTELYKDLLISVTNFFRNPEAFKALEENVIPQLFEGKGAGDQVRVWVTGCATGEEAYSLAILLHEYASGLDNPPQVKIFGTDISKEALAYRTQQQEAIARLGLYAMDSSNLKLIMDEVVQMLSDVLETEYTALLELNSTDDTLLVTSGTGWPEGIVGKCRMENDNRREAGYTLEIGKPVVVDDFEQEDRVERSPLLSDHQIMSSMNVVVKGGKGTFGVLGAYAGKQRSFTDSEVVFLQKAANLLGEAIKRVQAHSELEEANKKLKKAVKLRDDFLAIASHELQTPITSIKAHAELFQLQLLDAGNQTYAEQAKKINNRIDQLSELTANLLDISRIQAGGLTLEKKSFPLDKLIEGTAEALQPVSHHDIEIEAGEVKKNIYADRSRIGQVLTNLLENAIKYSPEANKVIVRYGEEDGQAIVSVVDFGIGIPRTDRERIFERFFKGSDGKNTYPGFGIGLYISSRIIKCHGGAISVEDNKEGGSIFTFTLPLTGPEGA